MWIRDTGCYRVHLWLVFSKGRNKWYARYNNKGKAVIRLNAKKHLYLTHQLLAPIHYVKVAG
jgi:hypothetical protein